MSFTSALPHRDSAAAQASRTATASGGSDSNNIMAKNKKPTSTETANTTTVATNVPTTPLGILQAGVRKAERAFLTAIDANQDGVTERASLTEAKSALAAFMANRLPLAVTAAHAVFSANSDITTPEALAAITELRSALSGIAKPATVVVASAPATS